MMKKEFHKYEQVRDLLRRSVPELDSQAQLEGRIISSIRERQKREYGYRGVLGFLFGWVYIGWVRRILVTASVMLVMFFVYQQAVIMKELDYLSGRSIIIDGSTRTLNTGDIQKRLLIYKLSGKKSVGDDLDISRQQMEKLIESVNELQDKYRDLINIINSDPELRKYIEQRLDKKEKTKFNL